MRDRAEKVNVSSLQGMVHRIILHLLDSRCVVGVKSM